MLGKNLDNQGLYIGKAKESKETILLNDLESNKNTNTLKVGVLGIGRAIRMNSKSKVINYYD
ncbi:hypothetical protein [Clostridium perfringens]|uniref:hypothetical protein n=1 Tax=Clostridium perfringens TaxID=1502 RepID=UPI000D71A87F|nr:hypothetical protein [Clostridium perfringens]MBO3392312.1 hypothetical protein [Clostridium perfringens]MBO3399504.1 hypothetical protein [Clostridium perfringens]MBO3408383.1 hypothetical protein [Clostridium perfringens]MBO3424450.1 hypothetical protein [Clostridium perfringens]MDM0719891.1 hypothetical protein [Clostridium perfringens]